LILFTPISELFETDICYNFIIKLNGISKADVRFIESKCFKNHAVLTIDNFKGHCYKFCTGILDCTVYDSSYQIKKKGK